ncbi:hypothetical protein [Burkholderia pseudomallei]|uniref:hypothetical protein n=1 Tax=Burkholderia pseudomallei TaxID=28450 RepID=UPI000A1A22CC|nr:hypothetical protein [Burkholderia pseudomallei]ARK56281.1 hypothetical protein BOC36_24745 [Burkholderia pseudomallei]ARL25464.1 hypothetical protein BOC47_24125 [Burkholderia pseudomallei]ARL77576.1 hypothetical protein BOC54_36885 [Burkholderia pseudomallei]ARL84181.1 hypothetical protein BOC55_35210 [Burkholderia pseudomallei]
MNVEKILIEMGGDRAVRQLLHSSPSAISQMKGRRKIADHLVRFFIALRPELDWPGLLEHDLPRFSALINEKTVRRLRAVRMRASARAAAKQSPSAPMETLG